VKAAEYMEQVPGMLEAKTGFQPRNDITVFVSGQRDDTIGEGIMRD